MRDLSTGITTHDDGTSHSAYVSNFCAPGVRYCPICKDDFGPAVDQSFVRKLRPGIALFLKYGHDDNH